MKIGIMQPYFVPYIGYWQLLNLVDKYVIYDDVNYIKSGWINRNRILINGKDSYFTIKLKDASPFKKINEIDVMLNEVEKRKMLSTIRNAYARAPYFEEVFPIVEKIIMNPEQNLAKFLEYSIRKICEYLDIKTELIISSTLEKDNLLKGKDKVIEICKILGATEYVNAIGGQELYDYQHFKNNNLTLRFLKTDNINYKQYNNDFISNLSIIDLLMFNSKKDVQKILNNYELIGECKEKIYE